VIVSKFGGSSVKDASSMLSCVDVVETTGKCGLVIISATYNTTNDLEKIYEFLSHGEKTEAKALWNKVFDRHIQIAKDLFIFETEGVEEYLNNLNTAFGAILVSESFPHESRDKVLSFGERLSSWLFFHALNKRLGDKREVKFLFAPDIILTDSNFGLAKPDMDKVNFKAQELKEFIASGGLYVTQGFLGSDSSGKITTLGREGSDYSATLFGGALKAEEVHIWTDVSGIYSVDPNVVKDPVRLEELSFDDASIMAKAGAKVLFPKTLEPLRGLNIPVKVGKTKEPNSGHTIIKENTERSYPLLGLTFKERGNGLVITLVGSMVYDLEMEISEIDRGDNFRSFFVNSSDKEETLNLWYRKYFC
jgi:aspartate kinase